MEENYYANTKAIHKYRKRVFQMPTLGEIWTILAHFKQLYLSPIFLLMAADLIGANTKQQILADIVN